MKADADPSFSDDGSGTVFFCIVVYRTRQALYLNYVAGYVCTLRETPGLSGDL